jgi:hypothetical protein
VRRGSRRTANMRGVQVARALAVCRRANPAPALQSRKPTSPSISLPLLTQCAYLLRRHAGMALCPCDGAPLDWAPTYPSGAPQDTACRQRTASQEGQGLRGCSKQSLHQGATACCITRCDGRTAIVSAHTSSMVLWSLAPMQMYGPMRPHRVGNECPASTSPAKQADH